MLQGHTSRARRSSVVTGAFGFSGQEITNLLLARGESVSTLTNHPKPNSPLCDRVRVHRLDFGNVERLTESLRGASVLYNTYWVRFPYAGLTHSKAVANTINLIRAAEAAGVQRLVHVSITNPSIDSPLTYFRGKAEVEAAIRNSSLTYAILRPAVLFGRGDILINNIAVEAGCGSENYVLDAVGPEVYTYVDLVKLIRSAIGSRSLVVSTPGTFVKLASLVLGLLVKDVVLTNEEFRGLMADLLVSSGTPTGKTSLREWIVQHAAEVGSSYASELQRHCVTWRNVR